MIRTGGRKYRVTCKVCRLERAHSYINSDGKLQFGFFSDYRSEINHELRVKTSENGGIKVESMICDNCIALAFLQEKIVLINFTNRCICCHNTCKTMYDFIHLYTIDLINNKYLQNSIVVASIESDRFEYYRDYYKNYYKLFNSITRVQDMTITRVQDIKDIDDSIDDDRNLDGDKNSSENNAEQNKQLDQLLWICHKCYNQPLSHEILPALPNLYDVILKSVDLANCEINIIISYCSDICSCIDYDNYEDKNINFMATFMNEFNLYFGDFLEHTVRSNNYSVIEKLTIIILSYINSIRDEPRGLWSRRFNYDLGSWNRFQIHT